MKASDPGLVALLERFDSQAVSAYREAVRLSVYYAGSKNSFSTSKSSKEATTRWRDTAHRVLRTAIENLKKAAA